jgi:hypothetical protein
VDQIPESRCNKSIQNGPTGTHHYQQMPQRPRAHSIFRQQHRLGGSFRVIGARKMTIGARIASRVNGSANANATENASAGPSEKSLVGQ